jgi:ABC-type multidrug transport system ATPase subunit
MDRIKRSGISVTVLLVEYDMKAVATTCEKVTCINFGNKIAEGTPQEICSHQDVIDAYLGGGTNACSALKNITVRYDGQKASKDLDRCQRKYYESSWSQWGRKSTTSKRSQIGPAHLR